ncbi:MAG: Uma2 family endonuclease [Lewinellaceae bacterium]|nr:Uma2 family endonuclease [Saprospiraceae bacterium]MCB9340867.1 Uma2 family endonuclease [Lewinellaceae bacterium]
MSSATAAEPKQKSKSQAPSIISKEQFLRKYTNREDGYKYEWNNGLVEKTNAINQYQSKFFIVLLDVLIKTAAFKEGGRIVQETDMDTSPIQLRRPDIAYYTAEQLKKMWNKENQVALFIVEVISPSDKAEDINKKLEEYFRAGVQVVWHIFPESKKVDVYTSPDDVTICRDKAVCSAAPVIPYLEVVAEVLFS